MAQNEERVMQFVKAELERDPKVTTSELFEKAKKVDAGLAELSLRQFNARFPLQIKRKKSMAASRKAGKNRSRASTSPGVDGRRASQSRRDALREVFLRFASNLASAEERKDVVRVLAGVDAYVDEGLKAAGR